MCDKGVKCILNALTRFQNLTHLYMAGNHLTNIAIGELRKAMSLGALGAIQVVDLHANDLGDLGVHFFTMSWFEYSLNSMSYLDLRAVNLTLGGMNKLAVTMEESVQSESLSILRVFEPTVPKYKLEAAFQTPFLEASRINIYTHRDAMRR